MSFVFGDVTGYFILIGVASVLVTIVVIWLFYHIIRFVRAYADKEERYAQLEIGFIRKIAEENKIDLEKEKSLLQFKVEKNFRTQIERKIIKDIIKDLGEKENE